MKDPSQTPIGQGMILVLGGAMLLGASSAVRSLNLGHFMFTFKGTSIDGPLAAVLIATFSAMGSYLFFSALGKIRQGSGEA
ncbi:hypothetical protein ACW5F0_08170 [Luteimonas sp. A534]